MSLPVPRNMRYRQSGFSLIEALIAALVLAVGLLGMAGLQAVSLQMNHGSYVRSQAANLAYEIADSMRANRGNVGGYAGNHPAIPCVRNFTRPVSGTVAAADIAEWRNRLACLLPGGSATITVAAGRATITVTWDETRYGGDGAQFFAFATEL